MTWAHIDMIKHPQPICQGEYENVTLLNRLESGSAVISRSRLVGPAAGNLILIHGS
jgi:hypothetical protein